MFCEDVKKKITPSHIKEGRERLYVYGTLCPGGNNPILLPGTMRDCGWFPGVKLFTEDRFVAEEIWVTKEELIFIDGYEGFDPRL